MPGFLTGAEREILAAAVDRLIPPDNECPGAAAAGAVDYVDTLLAAFSFDPPRIWAGGPFSGRHGGEPGFDRWLPLGPMEEQAWRTRIGEWRDAYRRGLAALGTSFSAAAAEEQDERLAADPAFRRLVYEHACEGTYGDPVYGGNRDMAAWRAIDWVGDIQPRGYTDAEVTMREKTRITD
jgi:hypothetical protein